MFEQQQSANNGNYNRQYTSWEVDKDFTVSLDGNEGICVRVSVLRLELPKYSYVVGWKFPNGDVKFHIQSYQMVAPEELSALISAAQSYIQEQIKIAEDAKAKKDAARQKYLADEKAKKEYKKKQYEDNKEKRRVENRQRANGNGGGKK